MNLVEAMRIYVRVAELSSFTQTAQSMGLPKANISTAVQQLESELGTRLLHRTTRRVQMTQDGQVLRDVGLTGWEQFFHVHDALGASQQLLQNGQPRRM